MPSNKGNPMKIYIHTLGCKVNQYESQALETLLSQRGHSISATPENCDAMIINSCAVTAESVRKSRQAVRRLRAESPGAIIVVCGCWPQIEPSSPDALGADVIYGSGDRVALVADIERAVSEKVHISNVDNVMSRRVFEPLPAGSSATRTRALLKLEDGCVNFCSYCIIPYTRGPVRSLPVVDAAAQARRLAADGYREIVLTGIEIASYGRDLPGKPTLSDAVTAVAEAAPDVRIRLGSLEPRIITEDFCRSISAHKNVCPHFHLSLQSGCDETLSRMKRKYDTARFRQSVDLLRRYFSGCGLTADLIVGFPGETELEFVKTLIFVEECQFSSMHIFPYSVRKGTVAASLPDQVDNAEKHRRASRAAAVAERTKQAFLDAQTGSVQSVLFEQETNGFWSGHAGNYALVRAKGDNLHNAVINIQIMGNKCGALLGDVIL